MEIIILNNVYYEKIGYDSYKPIFCKAYYKYLEYLNEK